MLPFSLNRLDSAVRAANALVKTGSADDDISSDAGRRVMALAKLAGADIPLATQLLHKALGGLAVGAGAAIPAAALGVYLSDRAQNAAREEAQKTRDFIENAALSLAGAGLGLYALHNLGDGGAPSYDTKFAAHHQSIQEELVDKLATIGAIDAHLDLWQPKDDGGKKTAAEMRNLNDGYLVRLLSEVIGA